MLYKKFGKRFFDLFFALLMFIVLLPVMLITFLLAIINKQNPIFFLQKRPGYNEQIFSLYKFASMKNAVDKSGTPLSDEMRITKFGTFIRKYSLDELPQLINIIKGNMSFVGPRPLLIEYLDKYDDVQKQRHIVKPGITGYAQVNGRNNITWSKKLELDIYYINNYSLILDIKILLQTFQNVVLAKNISKSGFATTNKFQGND